MRTYLFALILAATTSVAALADAPKAVIKGPASVDVGATIVLDARASVSDRPLKWKLLGPDVPFLTLDQDGHQGVVALVPAAPAGTYTFTLIAKGVPAGQAELDADAAMLVVVVTAAPAPAPAPALPAPVALKGTLHATLVVDLDNLTPDLAVLREGIAAREAFRSLDTNYRTVGTDSPELAAVRLGPYVIKAGGAPALIIQDAKGNVLSATRAPADEAGLIAAVKNLRRSSS